RPAQHLEKQGGHDLPAETIFVLYPAAGDLPAALAEVVPVVVHLGLVRALHHQRDRGGEGVLRPTVEREELLAVELEVHGHDRALLTWTGLGVTVHRANAGVLEDARVVVRCFFALVVEPEAGGERLAGHRTS